MQWNSVSEFFHMGGYAFFVWGSYGVTVLALLGEMWLVHRQRAAALRMLRNESLAEEHQS